MRCIVEWASYDKYDVQKHCCRTTVLNQKIRVFLEGVLRTISACCMIA